MARFSDQGIVDRSEVRDVGTPSGAGSVSAVLRSGRGIPTPRRLSRERQVHEAVFLTFSNSVPGQISLLLQLSSREWKSLLRWLDSSGLALYLLDRFTQLDQLDLLPASVVDELQQKMKDNARRTRGMVNESVAIQLEFQRAGLCYSVMKGLSLSPSSVPRPELRHQFDLDYLVAEKSAPDARRILEGRGYQLYAVSGQTWEFKINETPYVSQRDLYKDLSYRTVELHLEDKRSDRPSRLDLVQHREMFGITMPVFSPVDLFLGQAMHAFKDVSGEYSRTSHLLEFYRHVLARQRDDAFWRELRARAAYDPRACLGMGMVTYLITSIMGAFAPDALTQWTVAMLPCSARLWVDLYGRRTTFAKHPGTKLYLLLQKELEAGRASGRKSADRSLWPSRLPPAVIRSTGNDTLSMSVARYRVQARFVCSRLRFHVVEALRYAIESRRWRQHLGWLAR